MTRQRLGDLEPRQRRTVMIRSVLMTSVTWVLLVVAYYVTPFSGTGTARLILRLAIGLALVGLVLAGQIHRIVTAQHPGVRAVEGLTVIFPVFLIVFAGLYLSLSHVSASMFSQRLDHTGALYFTITTFSTTGFGDIVAVSDPARILVSIQMILDLVFLGVVVRLVVYAARSTLGR